MDKFEKNVRNNASNFNVSAPNKDLIWNKIDLALPTSEGVEKSSGRKSAFKILLLVFVFTILGFLAGKFFAQKQNESRHYAFDQSIEFLEINQHYSKMVSYQLEELRISPVLDDLEKKDFLVYIDELNIEQEKLKEELKSNIDNREVLEAIIENYEQQISLIDELLDRIDRTKNINYDIGISL